MVPAHHQAAHTEWVAAKETCAHSGGAKRSRYTGLNLSNEY